MAVAVFSLNETAGCGHPTGGNPEINGLCANCARAEGRSNPL